jgi:hypothetical protein
LSEYGVLGLEVWPLKVYWIARIFFTNKREIERKCVNKGVEIKDRK